VEPQVVVVPPGQGYRIGNVDHAPAGFDRRIGLTD